MFYSIASFEGRMLLAVTIIASGLSFLFGSAMTIAVPAIQADLGTSLSGIQWVVNSFTLALGVLILISGSLSDRYGRKRIFISGIGIFIAGLALSALAPNLGTLIAFQVIQGVGAAMMVPSSLAILNACFPENERGQVIGLWSGLATGIAALGPFVGGALVDVWTWRALFLALIPIAAVALFLAFRYVFETKHSNPGALDVKGTLAIALTLGGLMFGLIQGPVLGWAHPAILATFLGGVLSFGAFLFIERRAEEPIVPLSIFRSPLVSGANLVTLFLYFVLGGTLFFVNLNLQQVQDLSATMAGIALLPPITIIALFSGISGKLADRIGPRIPLVLGPILVAAAMGWMLFAGTDASYVFHFLPAFIALGAGMVLVIPALTKSALAVKGEYSGAASGVNNAISRVAWLLAVALLGAVAASAFSANLSEKLETSSLSPDIKEEILAQEERFGGIELSEGYTEEERAEANATVEGAFVASFRVILGINLLLALLASLLAFFILRAVAHSSALSSRG